MEGSRRVFSGRNQADVDAKLKEYLMRVHGAVAVLGMEYRESGDESEPWQLIFSFHITSVDDPCTTTVRQ